MQAVTDICRTFKAAVPGVDKVALAGRHNLCSRRQEGIRMCGAPFSCNGLLSGPFQAESEWGQHAAGVASWARVRGGEGRQGGTPEMPGTRSSHPQTGGCCRRGRATP
jgi:hypothetical protein